MGQIQKRERSMKRVVIIAEVVGLLLIVAGTLALAVKEIFEGDTLLNIIASLLATVCSTAMLVGAYNDYWRKGRTILEEDLDNYR